MPEYRVYDSILRLPSGPQRRSLRLAVSAPASEAEIFAKAPEFLKPDGGIKDRIAQGDMIEKAEREGPDPPRRHDRSTTPRATRPGPGPLVCALKGYRVKMVVRDSLGPEKVKFLKALDVEVVSGRSPPPARIRRQLQQHHPRIARETPPATTSTSTQPDNNECHYRTTPPGPRSGSRWRDGSTSSWPARHGRTWAASRSF